MVNFYQINLQAILKFLFVDYNLRGRADVVFYFYFFFLISFAMYVFGIRVSASFKRIKPFQELRNVSSFIYPTSIYLIFCILFKLLLIKKQK